MSQKDGKKKREKKEIRSYFLWHCKGLVLEHDWLHIFFPIHLQYDFRLSKEHSYWARERFCTSENQEFTQLFQPVI